MEKPELFCIGHRGAMGHEAENTLNSVRKAMALGAPCIEVDVYYVDAHLMVFHDDRLERTTNGSGYICKQSFDYLRSLDAGGGQQIPTLDEVCQLVDSQIGINIELKGENTAVPVADLLSKLIGQGWDSRLFLVSSFDYSELLIFKQQLPQIKLGALMRQLPTDGATFAEALAAYSVHPSLDSVNRDFVKDAHHRGFKVFVYSVDEEKDIERMYQLGVDGVFTNYPERVLEHYAQPRLFNRGFL